LHVDIRPPVCLSVTLRHYAKTAKYTFSPPDSPIILLVSELMIIVLYLTQLLTIAS